MLPTLICCTVIDAPDRASDTLLDAPPVTRFQHFPQFPDHIFRGLRWMGFQHPAGQVEEQDGGRRGDGKLAHGGAGAALDDGPGHPRLGPGRAQHRLVLLLRESVHDPLDHGREGCRQRHLEQWQPDLVGNGHEVLGDLRMRETGAEPHCRHPGFTEAAQVSGPVGGGQRKPDAGGEEQFAAGEPPEGVLQFGGVGERDLVPETGGATLQLESQVRLGQHPANGNGHVGSCALRSGPCHPDRSGSG